MTGPQATDRPHTPPASVAQSLRNSGVRIYPVTVGRRINQPEVLSLTPNVDDVTHVPSYPQLSAAAATVAPVVAEGTVIVGVVRKFQFPSLKDVEVLCLNVQTLWFLQVDLGI